MILIKENVEKIVDDSSQGVIDQLLLKGWSKLPDQKPKKKKTESKKAESKEPEVKAESKEPEVNADAQTV